jgi:hypothetical protein
LILQRFQDVDARDKRGHDGSMVGATGMIVSEPRRELYRAPCRAPIERFFGSADKQTPANKKTVKQTQRAAVLFSSEPQRA